MCSGCFEVHVQPTVPTSFIKCSLHEVFGGERVHRQKLIGNLVGFCKAQSERNRVDRQRFMMEASSLEESDLKGMEVCNFSGTEVALPLELIEQVSSFHIILF